MNDNRSPQEAENKIRETFNIPKPANIEEVMTITGDLYKMVNEYQAKKGFGRTAILWGMYKALQGLNLMEPDDETFRPEFYRIWLHSSMRKDIEKELERLCPEPYEYDEL